MTEVNQEQENELRVGAGNFVTFTCWKVTDCIAGYMCVLQGQ